MSNLLEDSSAHPLWHFQSNDDDWDPYPAVDSKKETNARWLSSIDHHGSGEKPS